MTQTTTDHKVIQEWAERHKGKPAVVKKTHNTEHVGTLRIMFPTVPNSEHDDLAGISWHEFFWAFEERKLALLYEPEGTFNRFIARGTPQNLKDKV